MPLKYKVDKKSSLTKMIDMEDLKIKENLNKRCFLCREEMSEEELTVEHVFPRWIQKRFDLWEKKMTLPNEQKITYNKMLVPCCKTCNGGIMSEIESEIRKASENGYDSFIQIDERKIAWWLYKIYYGLIVKGTTLRYDIKNPMSKKIIEEEFIEKNQGLYLYMEELIKGTKFSLKPYELYLFRTTKDSAFDFLYSTNSHTICIKMNDISALMCLDSFGLFTPQYKREIDILKNKKQVTFLEVAELFARVDYFKSHYGFKSIEQLVINENGPKLNIQIQDLRQLKEFDLRELHDYLLNVYQEYGIDTSNYEYQEGKMISIIRND